MICPNCNSEVKDGMKFCPKCGTKIPRINIRRVWIGFFSLILLCSIVWGGYYINEWYKKQKELAYTTHIIETIIGVDCVDLRGCYSPYDEYKECFTDSFLESRTKVLESINKVIGEPYKQEIEVYNIWNGASYCRRFGDDNDYSYKGKGKIKDEAEVRIESCNRLSDSIANVNLSYRWGNLIKQKTVILVYNYQNKRWLIDDLLFEGKSQKVRDENYCQEIQRKIDDYYKDWKFEWQRRHLFPIDDDHPIYALDEGGLWVTVVGTPLIIGENDNWYKTYSGFVKKGSAKVLSLSYFIAEDLRNNKLELLLQEPDLALITVHKKSERKSYKGFFYTLGAKFFFHCDSLDNNLTGRFEDNNSIVWDETSLKEIGCDTSLAIASNPNKPEETKSSSTTSSRETCWYCKGVGQAIIPGVGYTLCPQCHGTGFLRDGKAVW